MTTIIRAEFGASSLYRSRARAPLAQVIYESWVMQLTQT